MICFLRCLHCLVEGNPSSINCILDVNRYSVVWECVYIAEFDIGKSLVIVALMAVERKQTLGVPVFSVASVKNIVAVRIIEWPKPFRVVYFDPPITQRDIKAQSCSDSFCLFTSNGAHVIHWICLPIAQRLNRTPAMVLLAAPLFRVLFLRGHISLKNRSYRPLLRASTSPFKSTCLFIYLKEPLLALYRRYKYWQVPF
jgi:hypothetical protein